MKQITLGWKFLKYTGLNILGMLGLSCYILADTFFVSKGLGTQGLTALNLAIPVYSLIHGSGLMLGMGGAIKYTIYRSQKLEEKANAVFSKTLFFGIFLAICFLGIGLFGAEKLTVFLGADRTVFPMTKTYVKVLLLFSPAFLANDMFLCFVRNDGNPKLSMAAMVCGSLSNVVLDYIFIFPLGMGILGAVVATGLAPIISLCVVSLHIIQKKQSFAVTKWQWNTREHILSLGFPSLVTEVSSGIVIVVFNGILLSLSGNIAVAAYGVIANCSLVVIAIFTGIAQGMQPLVSEVYGTGGNAKKVLQYAICMAVTLSLPIYGWIFWYAEGITQIFNSEGNRQLQSIAVEGLRFYFIATLFAGCNIVLSSFFAATEKTLPAHSISLLRGIVLIVPMAMLLSEWGGVDGVWLAFPVTEGIVLLVGMVLWYRQQKKIKIL